MTYIWIKPSPRGLSAALALCLAACSPESASAPAAGPPTENKAAPPTLAPAPAPAASPSAPAEAPAAPNVLTLEGLGTLRIGQPLPAGSSWRERGAQIPGPCRTISSPDFPGVYAIVEEGKVRRITLGGQSKVKLTQGIGTGASEAAVRAAFPAFREEPHKYVESPAKYLTAPNAAGGDPALRFEIGRDGRVSMVHVGTMPVLGYVEGCA
jgi:hypothetical protein